MMKKKILFVSEALWIGGIETALLNLLNRMDYEQYDVTLLLCRAIFDSGMRERLPRQCRLRTFDRNEGQYRFNRLYHLCEKTDQPSRLHRALAWAVPAVRWIENRLYIRHIRRQMRTERFDTCVIYSDRTTEIAVRAIRADQYLLFYHNAVMDKAWHDEIGYRKSRKIIAVSEQKEAELRAFRPKYADKYMAIHNLIDCEDILRRSQAAPDTVFPKDTYNLVTCGRVAHQKGMDLAVEACAELVAMGHENIHWWFVGSGPAEEEIRARIARLHMEDHVTMLGVRGNPYPYMKQADLYVQPSRSESYGLTIAEAMVLGKPIVSTNTDGIRIFSRVYDRIMLCECDAHHIARRIHAAMASPDHQSDSLEAIRALNQAALDKFTALL